MPVAPARRRRYWLLVTLALALATPGAWAKDAGASLQPYKARYQVNYRGLSGGQIESSLTPGSAKGQWLYETRAFPSMLARVAVSPQARERGVMQVTAEGVRPLTFDFNDGSEGSQKDVRLTFDWAAGRVRGEAQGKPFDLAVSPGTQDTASVQTAMILALLAALVGPRIFPKLGKGKQSAAKAQIELLANGRGTRLNSIVPIEAPGSERETGALANAGRQVLDVFALGVQQIESFAHLLPTPQERRALEVVQAAVELDVLAQGEALVEADLLAHVSDAVTDAPRVAADVDAVHLDLPRGRQQQPDQHANCRALARAVRAEEGVDRSRRDRDGKIVDRREVAETPRQAAHADDWIGGGAGRVRRAHTAVASASNVDSMSGWHRSMKRTRTPAISESAFKTAAAPGVRSPRTSTRAYRPAARAP